MSTIPIALNPKSQPYFNVQNLAVPCEGPRCQPLLLDFSVGPFYSINLQNTESLKQFSMVQAVFVDNSASAAPLIVSNPITGQSIIIAPGHQAYKNVLVPNPAQLNFQSAGGVVCKIHMLNFPVTNDDWATF